MEPAARTMQLSVLENGKAVEKPPQKSVSWSGRQVQLFPVYLSGIAGLISAGVAVVEGIKKNWVGVGLSVFVFVALVIVTFCYYRDLPIKTIEQSAVDIANVNQDLVRRIRELQTVNGENQKEIGRFQASVKDAQANQERAESNLAKVQLELKDVTEKLGDVKGAFDRIQTMSGQFRLGVSELAKHVISFANGNEKLKKEVAEIALTIQKMDNLGVKFDSESRELKENNEQMDTKLGDYKKLLNQLGTVVDVLLPDYEAHKESFKEYEAMRAQNAEMQKQLEQLKKNNEDLVKAEATLLELQKLSSNLSDSNILAKLGEVLKPK